MRPFLRLILKHIYLMCHVHELLRIIICVISVTGSKVPHAPVLASIVQSITQ